MLSLVGLIVFGLIYLKPEVWAANWQNAWNLHPLSRDGSVGTYLGLPALGGAIAAALTGTVVSYDAWNNVTFVASEIKNPRRNIGLSILLGTLLVTLLYVSLNVMFTAVLPLADIAGAEKDCVGITAAQAIFGKAGTAVIAITILIATFGCNNGLILAGARVYYSMARNGLFFRKTAHLNKHAVPEFALWIQAVVASLLCLSGRYGNLLDMISFVVVLFYILTIWGIFILRKKQPTVERSYRAFGYPVLPALYIAMGIAFCSLLIIYKPTYTWPGLLIALIGVPIYYWLVKHNTVLAGEEIHV